MDRVSEFIKGKGLFGGCPTQDFVNELELRGVRYFIDLTYPSEKKITNYTTRYSYTRYPIRDHCVPKNWQTFAKLIIETSQILKNLSSEEKLYINCRGGHGRSGILVACLLCYIKKISPSEAITRTTIYHNRRKTMKDKWRKIGSPQTRSQKRFVAKFFEPIYVYSDEIHNENRYKYFSYGFSNISPYIVTIKNFGMFPNAEAAFQSFKNPYDNDFVKELELSTNSEDIKKIIKDIKNNSEWEKNKISVMYKIIGLKFNQHQDLKEKLLNTGLRQIIVYSEDPYWGYNENKNSTNMTGKLIEKFRKELYFHV